MGPSARRLLTKGDQDGTVQAHDDWRAIRIGINAADLLGKDHLITQDDFAYSGEGRAAIGNPRFRWRVNASSFGGRGRTPQALA
jgi:hypothetical protein